MPRFRHHPESAVATALEYVSARAEEALAEGVLRLPNVRHLAAAAKVSPKTAWKAVQMLRWRGVLTVVPGGGIFVVPGSAPGKVELPADSAPPPHARVNKAEMVRRAVSHDILAGRWPPGSMLPPYKVLQQHYGACYLTMRRALQALVAERRLDAYGKGFRVHQAPAQRGRPVLSYIYSRHLGATRGLVHATLFSPGFWAEVEKERVRLNIDVDLVHHDSALGLGQAPDGGPRLAERYRHRSVLGCMVSTLGLDAPDLEAVLLEAAARRWRTSVLCEGRDPQVSPALLRHPLLRFFAFAGGTGAGAIVAEYLLGLGHRHVAVFSPYKGAPYTAQRIRGMREAFDRAGECRLEVVEGDVHAWRAAAMNTSLYRTFRRQAQRFEERTTPPYENSGGVFDRKVSLYMTGQMLKKALVPSFEQVLGDKSITAWVGINDEVGLIALTYLRGNGVRVPEDISVVSYDDTVDAFGQGLTSYNFNVPGVVQAMFRHIMEPGGGREGADDILEVPGTVMSRPSSDRAPVRRARG
ncbi:MAG: GntR family transcriptional regulator [Chitinivibrionales bacterium]|nr:GntR family transcriptional regulator [Chitinivibrionales bacterium]